MRFLANISPSFKLTRRLSCNFNVRRYTSLVQVLQCQRNSNSLLLPNTAQNRFYSVDKSDKTENLFIKVIDRANVKDRELQDSKVNKHDERSNLIIPMGLLDLNPQSSQSPKVLLIPINWQNEDDRFIGNIISSIFAKSKHLKQIEAFSRALRETQNLHKFSEKDAKKNDEMSKEISELENSHKERQDNPSSGSSLTPITESNVDHLDRLAFAIEKALQQCCVQSIQMCFNANLFEGKIKGLKYRPTSIENVCSKANDLMKTQSKGKPLSLSAIMHIDASKLNLEEISWNKSYSFPEMHTSSLSNITFPINMARKSYSTRSTTKTQQNAITSKQTAISSKSYGNEDDSGQMRTSPDPSNVVDMITKRNISKMASSKCNANHDFPFLTNLFGAKEILLSSDAYSKALIEAAKRRAALAKYSGELNNVEDVAHNRPQVTSVKGCNAHSHNISVANVKTSTPCPPPMKKLKGKVSGNAKAKSNKMPVGCVSPKLKIGKKASAKQVNSKSQKNAVKQADGKKSDPECPNPCKEEMENLKKEKEQKAKKNKNKVTTGCKKAIGKNISSGTILHCSKSGGKKVKTGSSGKGKKKDICDDYKEQKPKCNEDPCKKTEPCKSEKTDSSGGDKKKKEPCKKKTTNSSGGDKKKEDPCKKKTTDSSGGDKKKEDPCKKKKSDPCGGSKKKEDPCKEKKSDPCGGSKMKEDPCKKKKSDPCGGDKKKEDPCKKNQSDPCGGSKKKEDPCKKKQSDPCGGSKKKDDPCKKKNSDPCGGDKKKEDPCKKKQSDPCGGSKKKEDPCKKKNSDPCGGDKKKEDPCKKKESDPCGGSKKKEDPCKKKKSDPCGGTKKKEDPSKNKKSDPCGSKNVTGPCSNQKGDPKKSQPGKKSKSKKLACGKKNRDTKPNCDKKSKCFSTLAINPFKTTSETTKRNYASLTYLPTLKNKNMYSFGFMRQFSSKSGKNKKDIDHGRRSQCKSLEAVIPPKRTPAYNPHPKDRLRKCFPTYDMDCKKLCKDPRKTACNKFDFLKTTDNNKRNDKK